MTEPNLALRTSDSLERKVARADFPAVLVRYGTAACFATDEFFSARRSNLHTRTASAPTASAILAWCEDQDLDLHQVTPCRFLEQIPAGAPIKNQALVGLRHFFDSLVARHTAVLNPFQSVRGVQNPFREGQTPKVTAAQARQLLASVETSHVFGSKP